MAWESRPNTDRRYYYRGFRDSHGRVRKVCLGNGQQAEEAAGVAARIKAQWLADEHSSNELATRLCPTDSGLLNLDSVAAHLAEAVLRTRGFHQHHGIWRKRHADQKKPFAYA